MSEDQVLAALKALREEDDGQEASPRLEARLMQVFQKHRARHVQKRVAAIVTMLATAAAAAAAVFVGMIDRPRPVWNQPSALRPAEPAVVVTPEPEPAVIPAPAAPRKPRRPAAPVREIATEFFSLLDVQPPFERGELVRMVVPAGTMRSVGLPVSEDHLADPVQADVLVGQEGLARAIRFVSFEK